MSNKYELIRSKETGCPICIFDNENQVRVCTFNSSNPAIETEAVKVLDGLSETATLHAQLGEARAELERVQTANNGDSSFPHFDSVVIPTEADADIKALGALLTPEGLGLYNRIARRNYDARRKLQLELNEAREALGHWMQRAEWAEKRESAQIARMKMREGELVGALKTIASYDEHSKHGEGICPYGCDTPHIARAALQSLRALTE